MSLLDEIELAILTQLQLGLAVAIQVVGVSNLEGYHGHDCPGLGKFGYDSIVPAWKQVTLKTFWLTP